MSARATQHAPDRGQPDGRRPSRRAGGAAAHSLRIGRFFGVPLQVHWSFVLLLGLVVVSGWSGGAGAIAGGLLWVAALFASVVVHELAHCLVARRRGGAVLGILLLPIGGMSRMDYLPPDPGDEAAIAAAGPATSLALGAALLAIGALLGSAMWPPLVAGSWWTRLGWLNVLLAVFNLLPALPMDGGRVLRASLSRRLPRPAATRIAATVARVVALGLVVVGVFYDFWLVFVGMFVLFGASREVALARAEQAGEFAPFVPYPEQPPAGSWPPPWGQQPLPWGQQPSPRSAIDVAVERRGPHPGVGQPSGEGVGEHD